MFTYQLSFEQQIETDIVANEKKMKDLKAELAQLLDLNAIKREQYDILNKYKFDRENSWRSLPIIRNKTIDEHIKSLQEIINQLDVHYLIGYMQRLNKEVSYASEKNGDHYLNAMKEMKSAFINAFDKKAHDLLHSIAYSKDERNRLISKQNRNEKYDTEHRDCVNSFKKTNKKVIEKKPTSFAFYQPKKVQPAKASTTENIFQL